MNDKLPVNLRNRPKTLFHVVEGGERTYIHPYSYYNDDWNLNSVQFIRTPEFPPDQTGNLDFLFDIYNPPFKKGWITVRRVCRFLKYVIKYRGRFMDYLWERDTPIYCAEIYRGPVISVPGTLVPSNSGSRLTDTYYLVPSQEWIKDKLANWLMEPKPEDDDMGIQIQINNNGVWEFYHDFQRNSYLTWARKQVECGRTIGFLTSLDT